MNIALIEDNEVYIKLISKYLEAYEDIELVGAYTNPIDALKSDNSKVDLWMLDVELPQLNAFEILNAFGKHKPVVLISGNAKYGAEAFEYNTIDFLKKPFDSDRFHSTIEKAIKYFERGQKNAQSNQETANEIYVKSGKVWVKVKLKDLYHIKSNNDKIVLYLDNQEITVNSTLTDFYEKLPQNLFMRIHRSYIVNIKKVEKVDGEVIEVNERTLPVSNTYLSELYDRLNLV
jgi:DNA-binding LytR/AlgR family response regulator